MAEKDKRSWFGDLGWGALGMVFGIFTSQVPVVGAWLPITPNKLVVCLSMTIFVFALSHWIDNGWRQIGNVATGLLFAYLVVTFFTQTH